MGGAFRKEIFKVNDDRDDTKDYDDYDDYDNGGARTESGSIEGRNDILHGTLLRNI